MDRYLAPGALLSLGSFLLFMSLLLPLLVAPGLTRLPLDRYAEVRARGSGSYLSQDGGDLITSQALQTTMTFRGDVEAGSDEVAVWDMFSATENLAPGVAEGDRVILTDEERVALHRRTGLAVACCDESPPHDGLTLTFPPATQPVEYELWDGVLDAARPASFVRRDQLGGTEVLVFAQRIEPTPIGTEEVRGDLVESEEFLVSGTVVYAADKELWVEPRTGTVVRVRTDLRKTLEVPDADPLPQLTLQLDWAEDKVAEQMSYARSQASRARRYAFTYPVAALLGGALALGAGIVMTGRVQRSLQLQRDEDAAGFEAAPGR